MLTKIPVPTIAPSPIIVAPKMPTSRRSDFGEGPAADEVADMDFTYLTMNPLSLLNSLADNRDPLFGSLLPKRINFGGWIGRPNHDRKAGVSANAIGIVTCWLHQ